ncbi:hypothetical protein RhiirC2_785982 [Rhizophagus irregularis]|uniref:Uncharacterized protein n=1 Tax=Rhizophagus irregularis TaxID=588596 RepID=A0A2N1MV79_9GLOM|nr:hypothetical protein RhiirC2_785982 [Rhizophagus irregularis]
MSCDLDGTFMLTPAKFIVLTRYTFDSFLGNSSLTPIFDRFPITAIHWPFTQAWLYHNSTTDVCSFTKSSYDAFKIKSLNHILPCGDIFLKHYPELYNSAGIPCPFCLSHPDTNEHLGLRTNLFSFINSTLDFHKKIFISLIDSNINNFNSFIEHSINFYDLFHHITNDNLYRHEFI